LFQKSELKAYARFQAVMPAPAASMSTPLRLKTNSLHSSAIAISSKPLLSYGFVVREAAQY
jgi:hypothetical protein